MTLQSLIGASSMNSYEEGNNIHKYKEDFDQLYYIQKDET